MSRRVLLFFLAVLLFDIIAISIFVYLSEKREDVLEVMRRDVRLVGLTDVSLVTEARFIRHRSLSDIYSVFDFSPEAREVFPFSFVYNPSIGYRGGEVMIGKGK